MWRILKDKAASFAIHSARTESIIRAVSKGTAANTVRLYRCAEKTVSIGRYQKQADEVREDYCRRNNIMVRRRLLPGNVILSGEDDVWWEWIAAQKDYASGDDLFKQVVGGIITALAQQGLEGEVRGSRLYLNSKVIGHIFSNEVGSCFIVQGIFQFAFAAADYVGSLKIPTEKISRKSIDGLNAVFGGLGDFITKRQMETLMASFVAASAGNAAVLAEPELVEPPAGNRPNGAKRIFEQTEEQNRPSREKNAALVSSARRHGDIHMEIEVLVDIKTRMIQDVRLSGNFSCVPFDYVQEFESTLAAAQLSPDKLHTFFSQMKHREKQLNGIALADVEQLIVNACRKIDYLNVLADKVDEISFVGMHCDKTYREFQRMTIEQGGVLLPYCSKLTSCLYRNREGCSRCGKCDIGDAYSLVADRWGLKTRTIQNYEMLEDALRAYQRQGLKFFIGICCPPFIAKHYDDFTRMGLPGLLIHLDNTTCYDTGREDIAHLGHYENQTFLNITLLEKVLHFITARTQPVSDYAASR